MLWNAKCFVRTCLGRNSFEQINNLLYITNVRKYLNDVRRVKKVLLKCTNNYYVNDEDKKELQQIESTLQRTHLKYLLQNDPELVEI